MHSVFDYIDTKEAERLIEQHDRYEFHGCDVSRQWTYKGHIRSGLWFVYHNGLCIECRQNPAASQIGHHRLADALEAANVFLVRMENT